MVCKWTKWDRSKILSKGISNHLNFFAKIKNIGIKKPIIDSHRVARSNLF